MQVIFCKLATMACVDLCQVNKRLSQKYQEIAEINQSINHLSWTHRRALRISDSWSRKDEEHEDCHSSPIPHRKGIGRCQSLWKFLEKFQIASLQKTSSMRSKLWPKFSIVQSISKVAEIVFLAAFWHCNIFITVVQNAVGDENWKLGFISGTVSTMLRLPNPHM